MNFNSLLSVATLGLLLPSLGLFAQDSQTSDSLMEDGMSQKVKYTLILPDEKSPESIKPEENNPFEVVGLNDKENENTEENKVSEILLSLPARGGGVGPEGMRVMLGSMRLVAGQKVPNVLPDQQVEVRVKSITSKKIEMVWIEKKPTGLPPKPFVIDVDVSPSVRFKLPTQSKLGGAQMGVIRKDDFVQNQEAALNSSRLSASQAPKMAAAPSSAIPVDEPETREPSSPPATSLSTPEAAVLNMLFGNHAKAK